MARIKYYNAGTASWKYADTAGSVKTPVKGVDYFTEAEIQEVAERSAEMVKMPEGVGALKLLVDYTTEVETMTLEIPAIDFMEDMDGNPISIQNVLIRIIGTVTNTTDNDAALRISFNDINFVSANTQPPNGLHGLLFFASADGSGNIVSIQTMSNTSIQKQVLTNMGANIMKIRITGNNANKTHLAAGANIRIWGW